MPFMDLRQAACTLGIERAQLHRLIDAGRLRGYRIGSPRPTLMFWAAAVRRLVIEIAKQPKGQTP